MKNNCKSLSVLCLSILIAGLTGCNRNTTPPEDRNKVCITIATYQGGLGSDWIRQICEELKQQLADYTDSTFKDGQKGVRFEILENTAYGGDKLATGLQDNVDLYFTESVDYALGVNHGYYLDITDLLKEPLTDVGDTGTILDKIDPGLAQYLSFKDNKFYAVPFYDGFYNLYYDVDVFDEQEWYKDTNDKWCGLGGNLHTGADQIPNTFDDGLPRTFEEFNALCRQISTYCYPIGYPGGNASIYVNRFIKSIWTTYEGYDQTMLNYNFNGKAKNLISVANNGEITPLGETDITFENGYELAQQAGKYYSLKYLKDIFLAPGTRSDSCGAWDHLSTQEYFVKTKYGGSSSTKNYRFAMMVDGSWWQNEADSVLVSDEIAHKGNGGKMNRRFGIIPIPRVDEAHLGGKQTVLSMNESFAFINKKTSHADLSKLIFKYFHTNKYLSRFSSVVGMTRALNYTLEESDLDNCSYYTKNLMDMKNQSEIVFPYSSDSRFINRASYFNQHLYPYAYSATQPNPISDFLGIGAYNNPVTYFNGIVSYYKNSWSK